MNQLQGQSQGQGINTSRCGTTTSTTINGTMGLYSAPELIDTIVTPTSIELVYKRYSMIQSGFFPPRPEVYKVVYSRHDGSEKTVFGEYIPASGESYSFD